MKWLKLAGIASLIFATLAVGVATYLVFGNTAWLKAELSKAAQEQWRRTLTIEGDLTFSLWPELGFRVGKVSLSEPDGDRSFARIDGARISVALRPLWDRRIVVTSFTLEGSNLLLARRADGTLNFADLRPPPTRGGRSSDSPPWIIDIAGVNLTNAHLNWRDERAGMSVALSVPALTTGPIADGRLAIDDIAGQIDVVHPKLPTKSLTLPIGGRLEADFEKSSASGALSSRLDGSDIALRFDVTRFAPLSLVFDLAVDHIDLDKYLSRDGDDSDGRIDLSALKGLDIRGDIRIGRLRFGQVLASHIALAFDAAAGALELTPRAMSGGTARRDDGRRPGRPAAH